MPSVIHIEWKLRKLLRVGAVVVAVLVLAAGAWWMFDRWSRQADDKQYTTVVTQADDLLQRERLDDALLAYQDYLKQSRYGTHRTEMMLRVAAVYDGKGDYPKALQQYRQLESSGQENNLQVVLGVADASAKTDDSKTAIEYYKKAIELRRASDNPMRASYIEEYEATIKMLETGGK